MRVLIISAAFPPMNAGEADHALYLSRRLAERGLDVHVLTTRGHLESSDFPFKVYPIMRDWSWRDAIRLVRFVKSCRPDVVLLWYLGWIYNEHPMITFAATISKLLLSQVVFVTQFANVEGARKYQHSLVTRLFRKGLKVWTGENDVSYEHGTLLRDSDSLIVLSDLHKAELTRHYSQVAGKSVLIPPPCLLTMCQGDEEPARRRGREVLGVKAEEILLLYLGYIYPAKGIETLLRAFQIICQKRSDVKLVLVGGVIEQAALYSVSHKQYLTDLAKQLGIDDRIKWTGAYNWDSDDASYYLRAADIFVLPIHVGVQMNNSSFAAAASHGLPVVATRGSIVEKQFVHGENVFLCPPKNPEAMADGIEALINNVDIRQRLRRGALDLANEWFSWDGVIQRTVETFVNATLRLKTGRVESLISGNKTPA